MCCISTAFAVGEQKLATRFGSLICFSADRTYRRLWSKGAASRVGASFSCNNEPIVILRNVDWPIAKGGPTIGSVDAQSFRRDGESFKVDDVSLVAVADGPTDGFLGYLLCMDGLYPLTHCVVQRFASLFWTHREP
jgi:hypothetical protein